MAADRFWGARAPARARASCMRFPTNRFRRSASSRIVSRASIRSASVNLDGSARFVTAAVIEASGVRRSWVTAENSAARRVLASASAWARLASEARRAASIASATWDPSDRPKARAASGIAGRRAEGTILMRPTSRSLVRIGTIASSPAGATSPSTASRGTPSTSTSHRARSNSATAARAASRTTAPISSPASSRSPATWSSRASRSLPSAASRSRSVLESSVAAPEETARNTTSATRSSARSTRSVWTGSVKKKFRPRNERIAARIPAGAPPSTEAPIAART